VLSTSVSPAIAVAAPQVMAAACARGAQHASTTTKGNTIQRCMFRAFRLLIAGMGQLLDVVGPAMGLLYDQFPRIDPCNGKIAGERNRPPWVSKLLHGKSLRSHWLDGKYDRRTGFRLRR
jgi:hypothetical protein